MRLEVRYVETTRCPRAVRIRGHRAVVAPFEQDVMEIGLQLAHGIEPKDDAEAEAIAFRHLGEHIISVRRIRDN